MYLVNYKITYARARTFIINEFVELIRGSCLWTKQQDLVSSCLSLSPDVTTLDRGSGQSLGINCLCGHTLLLQAGDLQTTHS